jgi:hypothetical protein
MAAPLMSNASRATAGTSPEGPPVLGSSWPPGIVSRITPSLREVLSGEVVSSLVADPVVPAPVVSPVVLPVDALVVPVVVLVVPVVLVPVVVPVVLVRVTPVVPVVVSARGPRALSLFLLVLSSRCMVSTSSKPSPQFMKSTPRVSHAKIWSSGRRQGRRLRDRRLRRG